MKFMSSETNIQLQPQILKPIKTFTTENSLFFVYLKYSDITGEWQFDCIALALYAITKFFLGILENNKVIKITYLKEARGHRARAMACECANAITFNQSMRARL